MTRAGSYLQVAGGANEARPALLVNAAFELRFDEDHFVPVDKTPDVVFACTGSEHLRDRKVDMSQ